MVRRFLQWGLATALGGALLGCTHTTAQQKPPPPDPLLVTKKPVEGKLRSREEGDREARLQPPAPPGPAGDMAAVPAADGATVQPAQLRLGPPQAP